MTSIEFGSYALRERVAPPSLGSVKARLRHAARIMGRRNWSANRVKDVWYADPRISPNADEIRDIEEITGLRYGREEIKEIDSLISRASTLLDEPHADFNSSLLTALRALVSVLDSSRTPGG